METPGGIWRSLGCQPVAALSRSQQTGAGQGICAESLSHVPSPMPALPETRQPVPTQWELVRKEEPPAATITQEAQP